MLRGAAESRNLNILTTLEGTELITHSFGRAGDPDCPQYELLLLNKEDSVLKSPVRLSDSAGVVLCHLTEQSWIPLFGFGFATTRQALDFMQNATSVDTYEHNTTN
jgi:hypothetical protein